MKHRVTIEFDEDDPIYQDFVKYVSNNYLTLTSVVKQAIKKFLEQQYEDR